MYNKNVYKYDEMKRAEHMAVRTSVGWYYYTHHLVEVAGKDATAFLDKIFVNNVSNLNVGRDRYTTAVNESGVIVDDVVIMHVAEEVYWVSTLFAQVLIPWLEAHKEDAAVTICNITKQYDMYAVQGPASLAVMNKLLDKPVDDLKFFALMDNSIDGIPVKINRAGFTGEKYGYEVYIAPEHDDMLEGKLDVLAKEHGGRQVTEFQIMALSLPTEVGFLYMREMLFNTPMDMELDKNIDWNKEFIGKEALLKIKETGPDKEILGFTIEEADILVNHMGFGGPGDAVYLNGEEVGRVAKLTYSFVKDINIGYVLARKGALKPGDKVKIRRHEGVICPRYFL